MPAKDAQLQTLCLVVGELQENCFLLWRKDGEQALVFDPGDEAGRIQAELKKRKLAPAGFLLTHTHCDHIGALSDLKKAFPAVPIVVPVAEAGYLANPTRNLSYFIGGSITAPEADRPVQPGEELELVGLKLKAICCPGHSVGGTAYFVEDPGGGAPQLFCGDILFAGGIGRGDLPGGEGEQVLVENIRKILFPLPNDTVVHPGHGPGTTLGQEKAFNPFCGKGTDIA
jgi:glyoxylase-like metal-dependent hydrolase (beta-lactamase superfamily II)